MASTPAPIGRARRPIEREKARCVRFSGPTGVERIWVGRVMNDRCLAGSGFRGAIVGRMGRPGLAVQWADPRRSRLRGLRCGAQFVAESGGAQNPWERSMYEELRQVWGQLTAEGGPFEIEQVTVRGVPVKSFKNAFRSRS